jgi:hypothetical protein
MNKLDQDDSILWNIIFLLNGVPGKKFYCKRGVRQGDPLSPLLFVLAADLLQAILNKALQQGNLHSLSIAPLAQISQLSNMQMIP